MRYRARVVIVCIVGVLGYAPAHAEVRWFDVGRSTLTVYVPVADRRAESPPHMIRATLSEGSLDEMVVPPHLTLVINLEDFQIVSPTRSADAREEFRQYLLGPGGLNEERYSRITYHSLTIDISEPEVWLITGELGMHGRFLPFNVAARRKGDRFTGNTTVLPAEVGVSGVDDEGSRVPLANEVRVEFDLVLESP